MPRGSRHTQSSDTTESQRGRQRIHSWRNIEWDKESKLSSISSCGIATRQARGDETMTTADLPVTPKLYEGLGANSTSETVSGRKSTLHLLTGNQQPEAKTRVQSLEATADYSSVASNGSSNAYTKVQAKPNNTKPMSLLPFLGMPSAAGIAGKITSPTSSPQWMQLLSKQDTDEMIQDLSQGATSDVQKTRSEIKALKLEQFKWEKERNDLLSQQECLNEELEHVMQSKEEVEQQMANLQMELRAEKEHVHELEITLSTAQQALEEYRRKEPCDWVIFRDEIQITDKCLGVGGWGTVVLGRFRGCKVAVKQIHELILSPHNKRLFEREMNIASRCRHPCLLQFIGATNDEGSPLFVTELMETSLRALLEQRELSETEVSRISLDVAQGLNYLHKNKPPIIHRDISSANVLLWQQGDQWRGKVSDYGTANFVQQTMTIGPGAMIYSAPEALTSNQTVKTDVYSFGVLLCEMCIRELPDPKHREEQIALVTSHMFRALIRHCLQSDPLGRPSMDDIVNHFDSDN